MNAFQAFILGITQGVTEFLPVSSDGHLILVPALFGWKRFGLGFDVVLHAATLLATIVYFRHDVARLLVALVTRAPERARDRRLALVVLGATVPSAALALGLEPLVERVDGLPMSTQTTVAAVFLLVTAALLAGAEAIATRVSKHIPSAEDISWPRALIIGVAQGFAVAPGLSRSGTTMAAGVALGLEREEAARFSFLLSIPIVAAATAKKVLIDVVIGGEALPGVVPVAVGLVTTAVVGYGAIALLLPYVRKHSLYVFAIYTAVVGTAILVTKLLF
ncbi:MAG: undecaprenyl-diphosphate phosphatase [Coriobacteriales bacterium]|nr:undecaprenyl-diphosphate phosphatase [Actinomycetes bacterium]